MAALTSRLRAPQAHLGRERAAVRWPAGVGSGRPATVRHAIDSIPNSASDDRMLVA